MPLYYSMRLYYIITCTVLRTLTHSKFRPSIHWPINRMQWPTACKKLLLMSLLPLSYSAHKRCSRLLKSRTQFLTRRGSMSSTVVTEKSRRCFSRVVTKHFDNQPCRRAFMADHRLKAAVPRLREVVGSVAC